MPHTTPQRRFRLPAGQALCNRVIDSYRRNAQAKHLPCTLARADFLILLAGRCHYCGRPPSTRQKGRGSLFIYNGIDRLDNTQGYLPGNVVACCRDCNFKKGAQSYDAFLAWIGRVVAHQALLPPPPSTTHPSGLACPLCGALLGIGWGAPHIQCPGCGGQATRSPAEAQDVQDSYSGISDLPFDRLLGLLFARAP